MRPVCSRLPSPSPPVLRGWPPPCPPSRRDAGQAQSSPFSDGERAALHAEIRAYLLAQPRAADGDDPAPRAEAAGGDRGERPRPGRAPTPRRSSTTASPGSAATPRAASPWSSSSTTSAATAAGPSPDVTELLASDGDIRLIVKEMPILGPGSELAARAAVATLIAEGPEAYARAARPADGAEGPDHRRAASTRR